jgi:beta-N-acetylhexosaminidase
VDLNHLDLGGAPFHLDAEAITWVAQTHAALTDEQKVGQILLPYLLPGAETPQYGELARTGVGGMYVFASASEEDIASGIREFEANALVPPLVASDLEFDEGTRIGGPDLGTRFPNQLAVGAVDDPEAASRMAEVAARQGSALGINWSFTPTADLALNPRNSLIPTRSFGGFADRVGANVRAYVTRMEGIGVATSIKHFPGDGVDSRDQHLVTSVNALPMEKWRATFGAIYQTAIEAGTRTLMVGHISLPDYTLASGGDTATAYLPATLSRPLLNELLRQELGFRGLITSDASEMGGLESIGHRDDIVPMCVAAGCDILLFPREQDDQRLLAALESGALSRSRLDEASVRVLALKASLGLHRHSASGPSPITRDERDLHDRWAAEAAARAVTLVRDADAELPLTPATHPRLLLATDPERRNVFGALPELIIDQLLTQQGFEVERFDAETIVDPDKHSALLYVVAEESRQGRSGAGLEWNSLQPAFPNYMRRYFHLLPCVFLSFGHPFHSIDVPGCRILINAYSPVPAAQIAAVAALTGTQSFSGVSPVNAHAGLEMGELEAFRAVRASARGGVLS